MLYKECFDNIINGLKKDGLIKPAAYFNEFYDKEYDMNADILSFLISKNLVRFGLRAYRYVETLTWTKIGQEQLQDEVKSASIFEEFKLLYALKE